MKNTIAGQVEKRIMYNIDDSNFNTEVQQLKVSDLILLKSFF